MTGSGVLSPGRFRRDLMRMSLDDHVSFDGCHTVMWKFQQVVVRELNAKARAGAKVLTSDDMAEAIIAASTKKSWRPRKPNGMRKH